MNRVLSEERLWQTLASAKLGVWEWNLETKELRWSPELYALFDVDPNSPVTVESFILAVHPADRAEVWAQVQRGLAGDAYHLIHRSSSTRGGERWLECSGHVFRDDQGKPVRVAGVTWDASEHKQLTAKLRLADRMASVGILTASVAHEINTPLAFLHLGLNNVEGELARMEQGAPSMSLGEIRQMLAEMKDGAERVREILRDLRLFSRPDEERRRTVGVASVVRSAVTLVEAELSACARLVLELDSDPLVFANEARLGQVFLNLLMNAAQAIPPGAPEQNEVRVKIHQDAHNALVEVSDTGPGMEPEVQRRLFDPFFTTKPVGMGSGLGLSICHTIVTSLGGQVTVETLAGRGTTFRVVLPLSKQQRDEVPVVEVKPSPGSRRILIIDDSPNMAASLRIALRQHDVVSVLGAKAGLELCRTRDFDCILCDLMMPELDGSRFYEELARVRPDLLERIIFFTGGAFTPRAREFVARMTNPLVEKPFDLEKLEALIGARAG